MPKKLLGQLPAGGLTALIIFWQNAHEIKRDGITSLHGIHDISCPDLARYARYDTKLDQCLAQYRFLTIQKKLQLIQDKQQYKY